MAQRGFRVAERYLSAWIHGGRQRLLGVASGLVWEIEVSGQLQRHDCVLSLAWKDRLDGMLVRRYSSVSDLCLV